MWDVFAQDWVIGRFGWKANVGSVAHQVGSAFSGDIGLTSAAFPNDALNGAGRIGAYDAGTLRPLSVSSSHGVGPCELLILEGGIVAVANGGIIELPETGRSKRSMNALMPPLALIDARGRIAVAPSFDAVFVLPAQPRDDPCKNVRGRIR